MVTVVENVQVLLLAGVLLAACLAKLAVREPVADVPHGHGGLRVHGVPVAQRPARALLLLRGRRAGLVLGLVEGVLGLALLLSSQFLVRVVATIGFAGATWAVMELRAHRPEAGCGCFGGLSVKRVGRRSVVRAMLFTAAAVVSLGASRAGLEVPRLGTGRVAGVLALELALFASLSPELAVLCGRGRGDARARALAVGRRARRDVPCERRHSPIEETLATLHASGAWLTFENSLVSAAPLDVWREGCHRFLVYRARLRDTDMDLVFAVSTAARARTVDHALLPLQATPPPVPASPAPPPPAVVVPAAVVPAVLTRAVPPSSSSAFPLAAPTPA
ncbi:MauE/DoxX family redox-associated membrane protein [Actinomadura harenae]|uniref:MauE/DoxX family redox-associated membrane protein n=1 Tax=Actinomadura harenae TaxID=2483351 RepID=UPI0018F6795F|nr:MauE/DoxX family redox-associated membrane protein [Actinomadura harenae]